MFCHMEKKHTHLSLHLKAKKEKKKEHGLEENSENQHLENDRTFKHVIITKRKKFHTIIKLKTFFLLVL